MSLCTAFRYLSWTLVHHRAYFELDYLKGSILYRLLLYSAVAVSRL